MPSYVFDPSTGELVEKAAYYARKYGEVAAKVSSLPMPYVRGDLQPYRSPVTGKIIDGRAARREDLARSGCREVDPSEAKPVYKSYEFCQKHRLPYMGTDVPPPMTSDEKAWAQERKAKAKAARDAAEAVQAAKAEAKTDPDLVKFRRGNPKTAPLFKVKK